MPYISRFVQVLPITVPNVPTIVTHGLSNVDVTSVEINSDDPLVPIVPFTWAVVDTERVTVTSSINLQGCWIVVRAL